MHAQGFFRADIPLMKKSKFCTFLLTNGYTYLNTAKIKKSGHVTFEPLFSPNFIPNFKKILGAVFEICRYARTDGRTDARTSGTDIIGPAVFNRGSNNDNNIKACVYHYFLVICSFRRGPYAFITCLN